MPRGEAILCFMYTVSRTVPVTYEVNRIIVEDNEWLVMGNSTCRPRNYRECIWFRFH